MAKKIILKDLDNIEILPITRGELILDSSGRLAFRSNEFLATDSLPGLMSSEDKYKLDHLEDSGPGANNKVAQINTTTNDVYRLLFSETADDTDRIEGSRKSANLTFNPSTGVLNLIGTINANGGTISNDTTTPLIVNSTESIETNLRIQRNGVNKSVFGYKDGVGTRMRSTIAQTELIITDDGLLKYGTEGSYHNVIHSGNIGSQSVSNASTADKLKNKVKIWGLDFDGSANVDGILKMNVDVKSNSTGNHALQINNTGTFEGPRLINAFSPSIPISSSKSDGVHLMFGVADSSYNSAYMKFWYAGAGSTNNAIRFGFYGSDNLVSLLGNGNVGIGAISPDSKLHVTGTTKTQRVDIYGGEVTDYTKGLYFLASDNSTRARLYYNGNTETGLLGLESYYSNIAIILPSSKNVGIGTISPSKKLHVIGSIAASSHIFSSFGANRHFAAGGGDNYVWIDSRDSSSNVTNNIILRDGRTSTMILSPHGNNLYSCGTSTLRWSNVYSVLGDFSGLITSSVATGTSPFNITSTTVNANLNADLLDGYHATGFYRKGDDNHYGNGVSLSTINTTPGNNYVWNSYNVATLKLSASNNSIVFIVGGVTNDRNALILVGHNESSTYSEHLGNLYLNKFGGKVYIGTTEAATINSNVASATKLQTPRTIWGQSFDGTTNVSGLITIGLNLLTGPAIQFYNGEFIDGYGNIKMSKDANTWSVGHKDTVSSGEVGLYVQALGNVGIGTNKPTHKLHVAGNGHFYNPNNRYALLLSSIDGKVVLSFLGTGDSEWAHIGTNIGKTFYAFNYEAYRNDSEGVTSWGITSTNDFYIGKKGTPESNRVLTINKSGATFNVPIIIKGSTSNVMTYDGNIHPCIRFDNSDSSLNIKLIFTDYDTYRSPAGIKLIGNQGNEWFETDGFIYSDGLVKSGSSDSYVLLGGGGHKALSTMQSDYDARYVNVTGDTMQGKLYFQANTDDLFYIGTTVSGSTSYLDFYVSDNADDGFRWITNLYASSGNVQYTMMKLTGNVSKIATLSLTGNMTATGNINAVNLGINSSGNGNGISLYGGTGYVGTYGIAFNQTANWGTYGKLTGDWATYFTMSKNGTNVRGWIFRSDTSNVASINTDGVMTLNGNLVFNTPGAGVHYLDYGLVGCVTTTNNGWSGVTDLSSAAILGSSSFMGVIRSSGDNLYHYNHTDGKRYQIIDSKHMGLTTISKSLKLTTSWQDTGIYCSDIGTGSFVVRIEGLSDYTVGGGHYSEAYTGLMSSYSGGSNSSSSDEIPLHRCGHAPNHGIIYLRTLRVGNATSPKLQIAASYNATGAYTYTFKFRRII